MTSEAAQLRELYREVLRFKRAVTEEDRPTPRAVWQGLVDLLERQEAAVRSRGGELAVAVYRRAQYVMAALADETFLYLDWEGAAFWRENLLELHLFRTCNSGEEVFRRIDRLLEARDPLDAGLARIYLTALALGFRGGLRGPSGNARVEHARRGLLAFATQRGPGEGPPEPLFPEAYRSTLEAGESRSLPTARPLAVFLILAVAVWLAASTWLWRSLARSLEPLLAEILAR